MSNTERRKKFPIGIESFRDIRKEGFYYVDKTIMIRDLLDKRGMVNLFTRPRRFGKSLSMSMLKTFFEIGCDKTLFEGLEISKEAALCEEYMGRFPVISVSLKGVNGLDYATARSMLGALIGSEAMRFQFLLESEKLTDQEKAMYEQLIMIDRSNREAFVMSDAIMVGSLKTLSSLLEKHYGSKVIILIDEYDVPLAKAHERGYYDQMVVLIRNLLEKTLKTNENLYFAVLTGCLRVAKESIFTGLNNLKVFSIATVMFDEYFGFTDDEVKEMLHYFGLTDAYDAIKTWYDGYRFGNVDVYCPWNVISYCDELVDDPELMPRDYWSNTSGNDVIRHFIEQVDKGLTKREIENLIAGETVTKEIRQELTYQNLYDSIDHIWSVLYTTGYLTSRGKPEGKQFQLAIPNMEIRNIFTEQIMTMFKEDTKRDGQTVREFCEALKTGSAGEVERIFTSYLKKTISIRDTFVQKPTKENFYHGILLGILGFKEGWYVRSNKESGDGYSDILIEVEDEDIGIIIEVKYAEGAAFDEACEEALRQIEDEGYIEQLEADGMQTILKYGIACYKKKCRVVLL